MPGSWPTGCSSCCRMLRTSSAGASYSSMADRTRTSVPTTGRGLCRRIVCGRTSSCSEWGSPGVRVNCERRAALLLDTSQEADVLGSRRLRRWLEALGCLAPVASAPNPTGACLRNCVAERAASHGPPWRCQERTASAITLDLLRPAPPGGATGRPAVAYQRSTSTFQRSWAQPQLASQVAVHANTSGYNLGLFGGAGGA